MDVRELKQLLTTAATGSLILLGANMVLAGERSHEQPTRPHISAACAPNWGFNQTCWSRFPPVPNCQGHCFDNLQVGYGSESDQEMIYSPQGSLVLPNSQIVVPEYRGIQSPISVFPDSSIGVTGGTTNGLPVMPSQGNVPPASSILPRPVPSRPVPPHPHMTPDTVNELPPIPAPPAVSPNQTSIQRSYRSMGAGQSQAGIVSPQVSNHGQASSRYGNPVSSRPAIAPVSLTHALVANSQFATNPAPQAFLHREPLTTNVGNRYGAGPKAGHAQSEVQNPVRFASQGRIVTSPPQSSASYRNAVSMPLVAPQMPSDSQQLFLMPDYPTIPSESLRSTP